MAHSHHTFGRVSPQEVAADIADINARLKDRYDAIAKDVYHTVEVGVATKRRASDGGGVPNNGQSHPPLARAPSGEAAGSGGKPVTQPPVRRASAAPRAGGGGGGSGGGIAVQGGAPPPPSTTGATASTASSHESSAPSDAPTPGKGPAPDGAPQGQAPLVDAASRQRLSKVVPGARTGPSVAARVSVWVGCDQKQLARLRVSSSRVRVDVSASLSDYCQQIDPDLVPC